MARRLLSPFTMLRSSVVPVAPERQVLVLSADGEVRREIRAAVSQAPGARATFSRPGRMPAAAALRGGQIVVIDDEGQSDAIGLLQRLKADRRDPAVVYLAANHSAALEGEVRRAGASFYAVKSARDGNLTRVIEVLLARPES